MPSPNQPNGASGEPLRVVHLFNAFRNMGGVEGVLKHHHAHDSRHGVESICVSFFEEEREKIERVRFLGFDPARQSLADWRGLLSGAVAGFKPQVAIYHGLWGLKMLCPAVGAERRIVLSHGGAGWYERWLRGAAPFVDGLACVSDPLMWRTRNTLPGLGSERLRRVFTPVVIPEEKTRLPREGRPIVIGYAGRVVVDSKRSDRLGPLLSELEASGINFRLEILGDGDDLPRLRTELAGRKNVVFHGSKRGRDYTDTLNSWDVWMSVSDSEGTPLSMLEAMGLGCIPVFPRIQTGGDPYAEEVAPALLYERGDLKAAAGLVRRIADLPASELTAWQGRARKAVWRHDGEEYMRSMSAFAREIHGLRRISRPGRPWHPILTKRLKMNQLTRLGELKWMLKPGGRAAA